MRSNGNSRLAIVGASTPEGVLLRKALERRRVPGERVDLFGTSSGEAQISEYAGEARLVQEPNVQDIAASDVIFLCESGDIVETAARSASREALVVDVVGCLHPAGEATVLHPGINLDDHADRAGFVAMPHPLALVLAELLVDLERGPGLEEVIAFVLRPAADRGDPGVEELREQTVRLLNFTEFSTDVFGRQLAFNVLPQVPGEEATVVDHVRRLLGWQENRLALRAATAPLFHGHVVQLRVRPRPETGPDAVIAALARSEFVTVVDQGVPISPLDVPGEPRTLIRPPVADGIGGFWVYAVVGEAGPRAAAAAVDLAARLSGF